MAQQQTMYDDEDDIAQREAIATEEQNYQELSQAEKRHAAHVEALRDDEVEEDDFQERPRSMKKLHPKHKKAVKSKKGKKTVHKKSHSVKPSHQQKAQHMRASDFENVDAPANTKGMSSDDFSERFTGGRFDHTESLSSNLKHGHGKKHHKLAQRRRHHSAPKKAHQQKVAHADVGTDKAEHEREVQLKRDYNKRLSEANKFDGLIHLPNGKRMFVDDGTIVGGVNVYAQGQKHKSKAQAHAKHPSQHHAGHKKGHKTHKKHAAHKAHAHKKHDASHAQE